MAAASASMAGTAENADLVYKIGFFHGRTTGFEAMRKDTGCARKKVKYPLKTLTWLLRKHMRDDNHGRGSFTGTSPSRFYTGFPGMAGSLQVHARAHRVPNLRAFLQEAPGTGPYRGFSIRAFHHSLHE
jgi:hypothetical protein